MNITDENYKGVFLEDFVDFDLEELYLLEEVLDAVKNNKPIKIDSEQTEVLSRIQAKILILSVQP